MTTISIADPLGSVDVETAKNARKAYNKAFNDNGCLKMILNWGGTQ